MPSRDHRHRKLRFETLESRAMLAGDLELVKDIYPGVSSSQPTSLVEANGRVYFNAYSPAELSGLWMTDGTQAGTTLVKGKQGAVSLSPHSLTNVNGTIFFIANDGVAGFELWKSDGTEAGTLLVKDIVTGSSGSVAHSLTNVSGTLFFAADDGSSGYGLWKSDGTEAGTIRLRGLGSENGPLQLSNSAKTKLVNVNGTLFFNASGSGSGDELWKSDGTEAGTVLVKDILPNFSSSPRYLTNVSGTLFFAADEAGISGRELWKSDGTDSGTIRVKDILAGNGGSNPRYLTNVNGTLFFSANDGTGVTSVELWKSDGTSQGTVLVKDIYPGIVSSSPKSLTNVAGTLFFSVLNTSLWKSNGTAAGTVFIANFSGDIGSFSENAVMQATGTLYFRADNNILWKSNGTSTGTESVRFPDGAALQGPSRTIFVGDRIFVAGSRSGVGAELFSASIVTPPTLPGDYTRDNIVDQADYDLWRSTFGSAVNLAADGNDDGIVDAADYTVWREALPAPVVVASAAVNGPIIGPIASSPERRVSSTVAPTEALLPLTRGAHERNYEAARAAVFAELGEEESAARSRMNNSRSTMVRGVRIMKSAVFSEFGRRGP